MKIWIVSMECAGIAEAGGVKNVTFSLCKELSLIGHEITLFIPVYKCTSYELIKNLKKDGGGKVQVLIFQEGTAGCEGSDICGINGAIPLRLLMAEHDHEVCIPRFHVHGVGASQGGGFHVTLSGGETVEVFVFCVVGRKADGVSELRGFKHIGGGEAQAGHASMYLGGVVHMAGSVTLGL